MLRVVAAGIQDLPGAYRTCLLTGDAGRDATGLHDDPDLLGHVYVGPYIVRGTDTQLVLIDEEGAAGYLLSAFDTRAFEAWAEAEWWPALRSRYRVRDDGSRDAQLIAIIHEPERARAQVVAAYPAHLHIDLQERARGKGFGRILIERLVEDLRASGVPGVHLGVDARNADGISFYEHLGFREVAHEAGALFMGRATR